MKVQVTYFYLFIRNFIILCLFKIIFYWLCYYSFPNFPPLAPFHPVPLNLQHSPALSSCPWDIHKSSLSSLFPIPFLTSPCLFYAYQLCFFFTVPPLPPFLPSLSPLKSLHVMSISLIVPVLVVCLVFVFIVCLFFYVHLLIVVSLLSFYRSYFWSSSFS